MYVAAATTISNGTNQRLRETHPAISFLPLERNLLALCELDQLRIRPLPCARKNILQRLSQAIFLSERIHHLITIEPGEMRDVAPLRRALRSDTMRGFHAEESCGRLKT